MTDDDDGRRVPTYPITYISYKLICVLSARVS